MDKSNLAQMTVPIDNSNLAQMRVPQTHNNTIPPFVHYFGAQSWQYMTATKHWLEWVWIWGYAIQGSLDQQ